MNKLFLFLFKSLSVKTPESKSRFSEGWNAHNEAKELYKLQGKDRRDELCLLHLDKAIECGIYDAYADRGFILQGLDYHYDAIEDFNHSISLAKDDANLYFGRGHSRGIIGDYDGSISDLQKAIELSKIDNEKNRKYNSSDFITEKNWHSITHFYQLQLESKLKAKESSQKEHLKVLYERRIKEIKRRPQ